MPSPTMRPSLRRAFASVFVRLALGAGALSLVACESATPASDGGVDALTRDVSGARDGAKLEDSASGVDATKPAGEWNRLRLLISKERCEHEMNGVKYFEYVMGSEDFARRVKASKFGSMPGFAKYETGYLALQGDHGVVSFRNVKIRPIGAK